MFKPYNSEQKNKMNSNTTHFLMLGLGIWFYEDQLPNASQIKHVLSQLCRDGVM